MGVNTEFLTGTNGIIRIVTLIIGVVTLGFTADTFWRILKEEFQLAMVIITFVASVIWTLLLVFEVIVASDVSKKIDIGFHIIGGVLLLIAGIVWIISVSEIENSYFCSHNDCYHQPQYITRIITGILGIIDGIFYVVLAYLIFKS